VQIAFDPAEFRAVRLKDVCARPGELGDARGQLFRGRRCQDCQAAPRVHPGKRRQGDGPQRRKEQELRQVDRQRGGPAVDTDIEQQQPWRIRRGKGPPSHGDDEGEEQVAQAQQGEYASGQAGGHLRHEPRKVAVQCAGARLHRSAQHRPGAPAVALRPGSRQRRYAQQGRRHERHRRGHQGAE